MKNNIKKFISDKNWTLSENSFDLDHQPVRESQFTIGNGVFCSRGILEEIPLDARRGTYFADIYDSSGAKVEDLVNFPNPAIMRLSVQGEKLDVSLMDHSSHEMHLNMKHFTLCRKTRYKTVHSHIVDYESVRFISRYDKNVFVMRSFITAVNKDCTMAVNTDLDFDVFNVSGISEGKKRHFVIREADTSNKNKASFINVETLTSEIQVGYAYTLEIKQGNKTWYSNDEHFHINIKKGQTVTITKFFSIHEKLPHAKFDIKKEALKGLQADIFSGFDKLYKNHCKASENIWKRADIIIKGEQQLQKNIRFNLYHMIICSMDNKGASSIGAKTLSGEGYRGHVFWDTEIFLLPFFIYSLPEVAKSLLMYRAKRIDVAKRLASSNGFKGAQFPWESARTGQEETPAWSRDFDGRVIKIRTHELEHHITADIAFAVYKYYIATDDQEFMKEHGYKLLVHTAKFWASRVKYNKKKKLYEILDVIGPDEFHEEVDNNVYTNMMARWNIFIGYTMLQKIKQTELNEYKKILKQTDIDIKDLNTWKKIIANMGFNITEDGIIEQYDGFFKLKQAPVTEYDDKKMPLIPKGVELKDIGKYMILKQADIVMLMYTLPELFEGDIMKKNYSFYDKITVHKSSLSPSMHAIIASRIGRVKEAYKYYELSSTLDLNNSHKNTREGIHAANLGGVWQMLIHGFAGVNVFNNTLCIYPRLPKQIKGLDFKFDWKGYVLKMSVSEKTVKIETLKNNNSKESVQIKVFNKMYKILRKGTLQCVATLKR